MAGLILRGEPMMMAANRRHVYGNASIYDVASRRSTFPLPLNPRARQELSGKLTNPSPSNTSRESSSGSSFHILPLPLQFTYWVGGLMVEHLKVLNSRAPKG